LNINVFLIYKSWVIELTDEALSAISFTPEVKTPEPPKLKTPEPPKVKTPEPPKPKTPELQKAPTPTRSPVKEVC
jgi:hypothetical protein